MSSEPPPARADGPAAFYRARTGEGADPAVAALHRIGRFFGDHGRPATAARLHDAAGALDPDDPEAAVRGARARLAAGRLREAIELLHQAVAGQTGQTAAWELLAEARMRSGDLAGAEAALATLVELEPSSGARYAALGSVVAAQGRAQEALGLLRVAVRLDPTLTGAWAELGELELLADNLGEAERALRAAIDRRGDDPELYRRLAMALGRRGQTAAALAELDGLLHRFPSRPDVRIDRAVLLLALEHPDQARDDLDAALALDPGDDRAAFYRGVALCELGETGEGREALQLLASVGAGHYSARAAECLARLDER